MESPRGSQGWFQWGRRLVPGKAGAQTVYFTEIGVFTIGGPDLGKGNTSFVYLRPK